MVPMTVSDWYFFTPVRSDLSSPRPPPVLDPTEAAYWFRRHRVCQWLTAALVLLSVFAVSITLILLYLTPPPTLDILILVPGGNNSNSSPVGSSTGSVTVYTQYSTRTLKYI